MVNSIRLSKLAVLRAKTDRELLTIIKHDLRLGLHLATVASEFEGSERPRAKAGNAYAEAMRLLSKVYSVSEPEWREIEAQLQQLRKALDRHSIGQIAAA